MMAAGTVDTGRNSRWRRRLKGDICMGLRFFKRKKILPGVTLNMSRSGPSLSFGPEGLKYTIGPGGKRFTAGLPGTGFYYTTQLDTAAKKEDKSGLGLDAIGSFFKGLLGGNEAEDASKAGEKEFAAGMEALARRQNEAAFEHFQACPGTDASFMCGYLCLGRSDYARAQSFLEQCQPAEMGALAAPLGDHLEFLIKITEHIQAQIDFNSRGLALALAESLQQQGKYEPAYAVLDRLWDEDQGDPAVCLSFTELIALNENSTREQLEEMVEMTGQMDNDDAMDTNILYMRGYGLYRLGRNNEAISQLSAAVLDVGGRPPRLVLDICYLRGQLFELAGDRDSARRDFEYIYGQDPGFEDVAARLGH